MKNAVLKNNSKTVIYFLLICGTPLFFMCGPNYHSLRSLQEIWNLGHVLFFGLLTVVLYRCSVLNHYPVWRRGLFCFVVVALLGGAIELIQQHIAGRSCSLADVGRDLAGVALVVGWFLAREAGSYWKSVCYVAICSLTLVLSAPLAVALLDEFHARRDFPMLADFNQSFELDRWEDKAPMHLVTEVAGVAISAAKIDITTETYSGVSLFHFPRDWSGRRALQFRLYNPGQPVVLHFRVHDSLHQMNQQYQDRYNGTQTLVTGWNTIDISLDDIINAPTSRKLDITNIYGFSLFLMNQETNRQLYLDYVRLL